MFYVTLLAIFSCLEFSYAPTSVSLWGSMDNIQKLSVTCHQVSIHKFSPINNSENWRKDNGQVEDTWAISYTPIQIDKYLKAGVFWSNKNFPTTKGGKVQFIINLQYQVSHFVFKYSHVSSGFGLLKPFNPGVDHFSVGIKF